MYYVRKEHDQAYRRVQLDLDVKPGQYQPFTESTSKIEVPASAVLEVRRDDGTEEVIPRPESERRRFLYAVSASDPQCLCISGECPTARLWARPKTSGETLYKVPAPLKQDQGMQLVWLPCGPERVELCGDRYFDAAYELVRK